MNLQCRIFGETELVLDGQPLAMGTSAKTRGLLGVLLLNAGRPVTFSELVRWLWDHNDMPDDERTSIHNYLTRLRGIFKKAGLQPPVQWKRATNSYVIALDPLRVDYHRSKDLYHRGRLAVAEHQHARALPLLQEALQPWHQLLLADLRTQRAEDTRVDLTRREMLPMYYLLLDCHLALEQPEDALGHLNALLIEHEFDSKLIERKMRALHRAGRDYELTEYYLNTKRRHEESLDLEFHPRLDDLFEYLLAQHPAVPPVSPHSLTARTEPLHLPDDAAPAAVVPVPDHVPPGIRDFTARTEQLSLLDSVLDMGDLDGTPTVRVVTVDGPPGIGKSALVTHWANGVRAHFPDGRIHIDLNGFGPGDPVAPTLALSWILQALGVPSNAIPQHLSERTAQLRTMTATARLLLILDNARDSGQVRPLLPASATCMVVVTSRTVLTGLLRDHGAHRIPLPPLSHEDTSALLTHMIAPERTQENPEALSRLAEHCDGFPLAARITGGYAITHPHARLAELIEHLADYHDLLNATDADDTATLHAMFTWSYDTLPAPVQHAFLLLSLHPGREITAPAAAALLDLDTRTAGQAMTVLAGANLLDHTGHHQRYHVHDLIRAFSHDLLTRTTSVEDQHAACERVLDFYVQTADHAGMLIYPHRPSLPTLPARTTISGPVFDTEDDAGAWLRQECTSLINAVHLAAARGLHNHTWTLTALVRDTLDRVARYDESLSLHTIALTAARAAHRRDAEALTMNNLAVTQIRLHHYQPAIDNLTAALQASRELDNAAIEAGCLHNLGVAHAGRHQPEQARTFFQQALRLRESTGDRSGTAYTLQRLATLHHQQLQQPEVAAALYEHAIAIHTDLADLTGLGQALVEIAMLCNDRRDHKGALTYARQALLAIHTTHTTAHGAHAHNSVAAAYLGLRQPIKSIPAAREALQLAYQTNDLAARTEALRILREAYDATGQSDLSQECDDQHAQLSAALQIAAAQHPASSTHREPEQGRRRAD